MFDVVHLIFRFFFPFFSSLFHKDLVYRIRLVLVDKISFIVDTLLAVVARHYRESIFLLLFLPSTKQNVRKYKHQQPKTPQQPTANNQQPTAIWRIYQQTRDVVGY